MVVEGQENGAGRLAVGAQRPLDLEGEPESEWVPILEWTPKSPPILRL